MIRFLFLLILFYSSLFSCSLCAVYAPRTDVSIHLKADKDFIKTAKVRWTFAKAFSDELLGLYDLNLNKNLDEKELKLIESSLIDYIKPKNFLTFISYSSSIEEKSNEIDIKEYRVFYKDGILYFEYLINLNYEIINQNQIYIKIHDDGAYFSIIFDNKGQLFNIPYKIKKQYKPNSITYTIDAPNKIAQTPEIEEIKENKIEERVIEEVEQKVQTNQIKQQSILEKYTSNIKKYLLEVEKGENSFALIFLLFVSFMYGVIHALGPGHGKALAFSYFSSQKSSVFSAFIISLITAFIHIIGAFILVVISVFILQSVLNNFIENSISYLTILCAFLIMILASYILYRKLKKKSCVCSSCSLDINKTTFSVKNEQINFVKVTNNKPIINTKKNKNQDLLFVLTAGLIPCPGTVLLFVYAFILKTYLSVILASIAISLGMAIVIFASSFLGLSLNKFSRKSHSFTNALEIFAPIFMFFLGLLLLLSAV